MEKGSYVKDIYNDGNIRGIFAVSDASLNQARNGTNYWALTLQDISGIIDCKIWSPLSQEYMAIPKGSIVRVKAVAKPFNGQMQAEIKGMEIMGQDEAQQVDITQLLPSSPYNLDEMYSELMGLCREEFVHRPFARLARLALDPADGKYGKVFRVWPAARFMHHAYAGGLLEHTLGVFRTCRQIADIHPELDRQTLLAGALFHDLGKLREFSGGLGNDYTDDGRLAGHLALGVEMLSPLMTEAGLEDYLRQHLAHLILSHHGQLEFNAVTLPQTAEAIALHHADDLDAKLARCRDIFSDAGTSGWTQAKDPMFGRQMFHARQTPASRKERKNPTSEECLSLLKA